MIYVTVRLGYLRRSHATNETISVVQTIPYAMQYLLARDTSEQSINY